MRDITLSEDILSPSCNMISDAISVLSNARFCRVYIRSRRGRNAVIYSRWKYMTHSDTFPLRGQSAVGSPRGMRRLRAALADFAQNILPSIGNIFLLHPRKTLSVNSDCRSVLDGATAGDDGWMDDITLRTP